MNIISSENSQLHQPELAGPWSRFFARQFDLVAMIVCAHLFAVVFLMYADPALLLKMDSANNILLLLLFMPVGFFLNACIISLFGNSIGKAMFGIKVVPLEADRQFSFLENLQREVRVWIFGISCGFPILHIVTMVPAFQRVAQGQSTSYDQGKAQVLSFSNSTSKRVIGICSSILVLISVVGVDFIHQQFFRPKEWINPVTSVSVTIPEGWRYEADDEPDEGSVFYGFVSQKTGLSVLFAHDNDPDQDLEEYAASLSEALIESIALGEWAPSEIPNVLITTGQTKEDKYPTKIYLAQNGSDYWRVVVMDPSQSGYSELAETQIVQNLFSSAGIE